MGGKRPKRSLGAPDVAADVAEFWLWLDALSRALPTRQRDVIFLRYQHELTDEDIGEVLGVGLGGPDARLTGAQRAPQASGTVVMSQPDQDLIRVGCRAAPRTRRGADPGAASRGGPPATKT